MASHSSFTLASISRFGTVAPMSTSSGASGSPKYPVRCFSQMTCFPACAASMDKGPWTLLGTARSTASTSTADSISPIVPKDLGMP